MRKKEDKNQKEFLGMPMNWDTKNIFKNMWNKENDDLFPPKAFGIGWTVNFHAVLKAMGLIKSKRKEK